MGLPGTSLASHIPDNSRQIFSLPACMDSTFHCRPHDMTTSCLRRRLTVASNRARRSKAPPPPHIVTSAVEFWSCSVPSRLPSKHLHPAIPIETRISQDGDHRGEARWYVFGHRMSSGTLTYIISQTTPSTTPTRELISHLPTPPNVPRH